MLVKSHVETESGPSLSPTGSPTVGTGTIILMRLEQPMRQPESRGEKKVP